MNSMLNYERQIHKRGFKLIAGVDESGRGPLAGPVVAAAVIVSPNLNLTGELKQITDCKLLSKGKREKLFYKIKEIVLDCNIAVVDVDFIDNFNILKASLEAMRRAVKGLKIKPDYILIDGIFNIPDLKEPQDAIIKGDRLCFSIAAASILAKVVRDDIMRKLDKLYPQYSFALHKGYGTKAHLEALKKYGPSPIHRKYFKPILELANTRKQLKLEKVEVI